MSAFHCVVAVLVVIFVSCIVRHHLLLISGVRFKDAEVNGWGYHVSRNIGDYLDLMRQPEIFPKDFCMEKSFLVVMVHSGPDRFVARKTIRETWGQKRDDVSVVFLIGQTDNKQIQMEIYRENKGFQDIIQENFIDSYNNLTLKSVAMVKLFHQHCSGSKYLLKTDDDVFNNIELLLAILHKRTSNENLLMGRRMQENYPFRHFQNKWYCPYYLYPHRVYPVYLAGSAYVLSADVVGKLLRAAWKTPVLHLEDVYLTGICAKEIGLEPQHNDLIMGRYFFKCDLAKILSVHGISPLEMRLKYTYLKENC